MYERGLYRSDIAVSLLYETLRVDQGRVAPALIDLRSGAGSE